MRTIYGKLGMGLIAIALTAATMLANTDGPKTLEQRVYHSLLMMPYDSAFDSINFRIDGSTVYLTGDVWRPFMKGDAESAVKHTEGVTDVVNQIHVLPPSPFDNRIRAAEFRAVYGYSGLSRYIAGIHPSVRIIVDGGHVTLVGQVDNAMDKQIAGIRANGVPGVFSVENDLQVLN